MTNNMKLKTILARTATSLLLAVFGCAGACRAYFKIGDDAAHARQITAFNLNFGDDTTGIENVQSSMFNVQSNNVWFTLDGRRLQGKPTKKGIYLNHGNKVVIK